jgi:hypothetical protein
MISVLLLTALLYQPAPTFTIGGTVVHGTAGVPLNKVRVFLSPSEMVPSSRPGATLTFTTGPDGRFRFEGLAKGKYSLSAERLGFIRQAYKAHALYRQYSTAIAVGETESTENLTFPLIPGAIITGYATDQRGEPVPGLLVRAYRIVGVGQQRHATASPTGSTDDRGYYRIPSLAAGTYFLELSARNWRYAQAREPEPSAYPVTYYPGTTSPGEAGTVLAQAGKEARADVTVRSVPAVRISGTVSLADVKGRLSVNLLAKGPFGSRFYLADGINVGGNHFNIEGVPSGEYTLMLWEDLTHLRGLRTINLVAPEQQITLGDAPLPEVTATVELRGTPRNPRSQALVMLREVDGPTSLSRAIGVGGKVTFPPIEPGRYQILVSQGRQLAILSLSARGAASRSDLVDVPETGAVDLSIVADATAAELTGKVVTGDRPEAGALVLMVPRTGWENVSSYRFDQTDSDGTFTLRGVTSGEYLIFGFEGGEPGDYSDLEVVRKLVPKGRLVTFTGATTPDLVIGLTGR